MTRFIQFIARHTAYIYFILYCGISILLMQMQKKENLDTIRMNGLALNAGIARQLSDAGDLFGMRRENERLLLQNARLFSQVMRQEIALGDAADRNEMLSRTPAWAGGFRTARVVDRRFSQTDNILIIDAGRNQGIAKDMPVLTPDGLVGRVTEVSGNYAKVMPVINNDFKVSAVADSSGTMGVIAWKGGNERIAQFEHVPLSSKLKVGETLRTSGFSTFALRGVPIGRVARIRKDKLFYNVDVWLSVDFSALSWVLVSPAKPLREKVQLMGAEPDEKLEPQEVPVQ